MAIYKRKRVCPHDSICRLIDLMSFSEYRADHFEFSVKTHELEFWLLERLTLPNLNTFLAQRFQVSERSILRSGEYDKLLLICFLEQIEKEGHDWSVKLLSEFILEINGEIIDLPEQLPS